MPVISRQYTRGYIKGEPGLELTHPELDAILLSPLAKAGIKAGVDEIMISHIVVKNIDTKMPASLSPAVHKLLRKNLAYQGLMITDDLQMGAITQYAKQHHINADVLALKAGNDMLLGGNYQTGILAIKKAVQKGTISQKQINDSVRRILQLKEKLCILK